MHFCIVIRHLRYKNGQGGKGQNLREHAGLSNLKAIVAIQHMTCTR